MSRLGLVVLATLFASTGCVSYYDEGPKFAPLASVPPGYGVVYTYRPALAFGAAYPFELFWKSRMVALVPGSYAVWLLPEGEHEICTRTFPITFTKFGSGVWSIPKESRAGCPGPFKVTVKEGATHYVQVDFNNTDSPIKTTVVRSGGEALAECHLAPGGLARSPVADSGGQAEPTSMGESEREKSKAEKVK